jgi:hypothetical protein
MHLSCEQAKGREFDSAAVVLDHQLVNWESDPTLARTVFTLITRVRERLLLIVARDAAEHLAFETKAISKETNLEQGLAWLDELVSACDLSHVDPNRLLEEACEPASRTGAPWIDTYEVLREANFKELAVYETDFVHLAALQPHYAAESVRILAELEAHSQWESLPQEERFRHRIVLLRCAGRYCQAEQEIAGASYLAPPVRREMLEQLSTDWKEAHLAIEGERLKFRYGLQPEKPRLGGVCVQDCETPLPKWLVGFVEQTLESVMSCGGIDNG